MKLYEVFENPLMDIKKECDRWFREMGDTKLYRAMEKKPPLSKITPRQDRKSRDSKPDLQNFFETYFEGTIFSRNRVYFAGSYSVSREYGDSEDIFVIIPSNDYQYFWLSLKDTIRLQNTQFLTLFSTSYPQEDWEALIKNYKKPSESGTKLPISDDNIPSIMISKYPQNYKYVPERVNWFFETFGNFNTGLKEAIEKDYEITFSSSHYYAIRREYYFELFYGS